MSDVDSYDVDEGQNSRMRRSATDSLPEGIRETLESHAKGQSLSPDIVRVIERSLESQETAKTDSEQDDIDLNFLQVANALRRSNYRLVPVQASAVEAVLNKQDAEIIRVETEILRLQLKINESVVALKHLAAQRLQKETKAKYYQSWNSSSRLLPLDVLVRIFEYTLGSPFTRSRTILRSGTISPMKLSHVCSSWRAATFACPSFWNHLHLDMHEKTQGAINEDAITNHIELWFQRSNPAFPLSLSICLSHWFTSSIAEDAVRGIFLYASRVTKIYLANENDRMSAFASFLELPPGTFPVLETLILVDMIGVESEYFNPIVTVFDSSPCLRKVVLNTKQILIGPEPFLSLPWGQFTHLEITSAMTVQDFATILFQFSPQLESVVFSNVDLAAQYDFEELGVFLPPAPVAFENMRNFQVCLSRMSYAPHDIEPLIELIRLPVVRDLGLYRNRSLRDTYVHPFPRMHILVPPIVAPLRSISLFYVDIMIEELIGLLGGCPLLEEVALCSDIRPRALLRALRNIHRRRDATDASSTQQSRDLPLRNLTKFIFGVDAPLAEHMHRVLRSGEENSDGGNVEEGNKDSKSHVDIIAHAFGSLLASWVEAKTPLSQASLYFREVEPPRNDDYYYEDLHYAPAYEGVKETIKHCLDFDAANIVVDVQLFPSTGRLLDVFYEKMGSLEFKLSKTLLDSNALLY
ncbi:hypothetical protein H0H92_012575 [Tricholoma furcatifolium]|nr:hypothetical protein H0H92_012575 [Tricholoma furcatifolium]